MLADIAATTTSNFEAIATHSSDGGLLAAQTGTGDGHANTFDDRSAMTRSLWPKRMLVDSADHAQKRVLWRHRGTSMSGRLVTDELRQRIGPLFLPPVPT